jgi:ACS family glucarate transporter-like MFS transporter
MLIGFVWAFFWYLYFRDDPTEARWLSNAERDFILSSRQQVTATPTLPNEDGLSDTGRTSHSPALRSGTVWALCGQYFASNFTFFFGLTWFFPQLKSRYGLSGLEASLFAAVPMIGGAMGCWVSGWWVDRLYSSGRWVLSRRLPAMSGFILSAVGMVGSAFATTPVSSSIWFTLCIFGADLTLPPSWSTCVDIGRRRSGVISGTMNMAGNVGSFITSLAFPYLLKWTGSSMPFFYVAASLNMAAIGLWMLTDPRISLEPISLKPGAMESEA